MLVKLSSGEELCAWCCIRFARQKLGILVESRLRRAGATSTGRAFCLARQKLKRQDITVDVVVVWSLEDAVKSLAQSH